MPWKEEAVALAVMAIACTLHVVPASANNSYNWGADGSGACTAYNADTGEPYTPTNCVAIAGPWWGFDGYGHISGKTISCTTENYFSLQWWDQAGSGPEDLEPGIAYQTDDDHFTWDYLAIQFKMVKGSPSSPGNGGIGLDNFSNGTRHVQGAAGCLAGDKPIAPSGIGTVRPKVRYDFGEWEQVARNGKSRTVIKQVALDVGRRDRFRLLCPDGMVRAGGIEHDFGYAMKDRPDRDIAARTDVDMSTEPLRRGVEITLKSNRLPYPTVMQVSMACLPAASD